MPSRKCKVPGRQNARFVALHGSWRPPRLFSLELTCNKVASLRKHILNICRRELRPLTVCGMSSKNRQERTAMLETSWLGQALNRSPDRRTKRELLSFSSPISVTQPSLAN